MVVIETTSETLQVSLAKPWYMHPHFSRVGRIRTCEFSCSQSKRGNRTPQLLVIKFSRLESNQRPFVYQTNALNQLSYVRMLEPLLGIEPRTIDYKSIVIPFNYRGLSHACKNSNPDQIFWRDLCYRYTTDVYKK